MADPLVVLLGPTAVGKTKLAVALAAHFKGEIISADSRQAFRNMDIGTGKDLEEYKTIPYHLIDIKNAGEKYNVNEFKEDFYQAFEEINQRKHLPILCGGTGMYIHSILLEHELTAVPVNEELRQKLQALSKEGLKDRLAIYPEKLRVQADYSSSKRLIRAIEIAEFLSHNELATVKRPVIKPLIIGLQSDVEIRRKRILDRLEFRLQHGLIEEVQGLLNNGVSPEILTFYGLEYKFVVSYLNKEIDLKTLKERLGIAICQFAKRQMTFFRKMEKDGLKINWLDANEIFEILKSEAINLIANADFNLNVP